MNLAAQTTHALSSLTFVRKLGDARAWRLCHRRPSSDLCHSAARFRAFSVKCSTHVPSVFRRCLPSDEYEERTEAERCSLAGRHSRLERALFLTSPSL